MRKRKNVRILLISLAVLVLHRIAWVYWPSRAETTFLDPNTDETIQTVLTYEETVEVKKILSGHIRWPEWLSGSPACGFSECFSITIDGVCYMPAWDGCGTVMIEGWLGNCKFMDVTPEQKEILDEIIRHRE